jgi:hypothetical protein
VQPEASIIRSEGCGRFHLEHHGVGIGRLHVLDVRVPVLAGIEAELGLGLRRLAQHVEGERDVLGGERLAVVPLHVLAEEEHEVPVVVLPRPPLGEIPDDGVHALRRLRGIEEDEVVEARQRRKAGRGRGGLVHGEALGRILALHDVEDAARFWRWATARGVQPAITAANRPRASVRLTRLKRSIVGCSPKSVT